MIPCFENHNIRKRNNIKQGGRRGKYKASIKFTALTCSCIRNQEQLRSAKIIARFATAKNLRLFVAPLIFITNLEKSGLIWFCFESIFWGKIDYLTE